MTHPVTLKFFVIAINRGSKIYSLRSQHFQMFRTWILGSEMSLCFCLFDFVLKKKNLLVKMYREIVWTQSGTSFRAIFSCVIVWSWMWSSSDSLDFIFFLIELCIKIWPLVCVHNDLYYTDIFNFMTSMLRCLKLFHQIPVVWICFL